MQICPAKDQIDHVTRECSFIQYIPNRNSLKLKTLNEEIQQPESLRYDYCIETQIIIQNFFLR